MYLDKQRAEGKTTLLQILSMKIKALSYLRVITTNEHNFSIFSIVISKAFLLVAEQVAKLGGKEKALIPQCIGQGVD